MHGSAAKPASQQLEDAFEANATRQRELRGTIQILDQTGHTTIEWDRNQPEEVQTARAMFDEMVTGRGFHAFRIEGKNRQGARITTFDPAAEQIMLVQQLRGG